MSTERKAKPATDRSVPSGPRLMFKRRLRGVAVLAGCAAVLAVASGLSPTKWGYGTHRQLGLPACSMLVETGWPCPTCGLTTSVSALANGRVGLAVRANVFGLVIFVALITGVVSGAVEAVLGWDVLGKAARPGVWWFLIAAVGVCLGWVVNLIVGWWTGQLPIH